MASLALYQTALCTALITGPVNARMLVLIIKFDIRLAAEWTARGHSTHHTPGSADTSPASPGQRKASPGHPRSQPRLLASDPGYSGGYKAQILENILDNTNTFMITLEN